MVRWLGRGDNWPVWGDLIREDNEGALEARGNPIGNLRARDPKVARIGRIWQPEHGTRVAIVGGFGAGKTTLAMVLAAQSGASHFPEPWQDNPYLAEASEGLTEALWRRETGEIPENLLREVAGAVDACQVCFGKKKEKICEEVVACTDERPDRLALYDPSRLQDSKYHQVQWELLGLSSKDERCQRYVEQQLKWQEEMASASGNLVVVHVDVPPGEVRRRMEARGRGFELGLPSVYTERLDEAIRVITQEGANAGVPTLIVNATRDYRANGTDHNTIIKAVLQEIEGLRR